MTIADLEFLRNVRMKSPQRYPWTRFVHHDIKKKNHVIFLVLQKAHVTKNRNDPNFQDKKPHTYTWWICLLPCWTGLPASFLNKSRAWWWAVLLRTVWIALLSPSVAPLKIRRDKNRVANFTQKTKRHLKENDGLGSGNSPPNKKTKAPKNSGFFGCEICWENLIEQIDWAIRVKSNFLQTEKGSKWTLRVVHNWVKAKVSEHGQPIGATFNLINSPCKLCWFFSFFFLKALHIFFRMKGWEYGGSNWDFLFSAKEMGLLNHW